MPQNKKQKPQSSKASNTSMRKKFLTAAAVLSLGAAAGGGYYYAEKNGYIDTVMGKISSQMPTASRDTVEEQTGDLKTLDEYMALAQSTEGEKLYNSACYACHGAPREKGTGMLGPNLFNVIGAKPGMDERRNSKALSQTLSTEWRAETLDSWLEDPRAMVPETTMGFNGIKDPQDRADLIAYLAKQKPAI